MLTEQVYGFVTENKMLSECKAHQVRDKIEQTYGAKDNELAVKAIKDIYDLKLSQVMLKNYQVCSSQGATIMTAALWEAIDPIFVAYAALIVMALIPIFFGSLHALEEIKI